MTAQLRSESTDARRGDAVLQGHAALGDNHANPTPVYVWMLYEQDEDGFGPLYSDSWWITPQSELERILEGARV